jgi:hypothetical protein
MEGIKVNRGFIEQIDHEANEKGVFLLEMQKDNCEGERIICGSLKDGLDIAKDELYQGKIDRYRIWTFVASGDAN